MRPTAPSRWQNGWTSPAGGSGTASCPVPAGSTRPRRNCIPTWRRSATAPPMTRSTPPAAGSAMSPCRWPKWSMTSTPGAMSGKWCAAFASARRRRWRCSGPKPCRPRWWTAPRRARRRRCSSTTMSGATWTFAAARWGRGASRGSATMPASWARRWCAARGMTKCPSTPRGGRWTAAIPTAPGRASWRWPAPACCTRCTAPPSARRSGRPTPPPWRPTAKAGR